MKKQRNGEAREAFDQDNDLQDQNLSRQDGPQGQEGKYDQGEPTEFGEELKHALDHGDQDQDQDERGQQDQDDRGSRGGKKSDKKMATQGREDQDQNESGYEGQEESEDQTEGQEGDAKKGFDIKKVAQKVMDVIQGNPEAAIDHETIAKYAAAAIVGIYGIRKGGLIGGLLVSAAAGLVSRYIMDKDLTAQGQQSQESPEGREAQGQKGSQTEGRQRQGQGDQRSQGRDQRDGGQRQSDQRQQGGGQWQPQGA